MRPHELTALARHWLRSFEKHDVEALVSLYADDAVHTSPKLRSLRPETGGQVRGRAALRDWWGDAFRRIPQLRYVERTITADAQRVWIEYLRFALGDPDLPVAEVLEVDAAGFIRESRVYHG